MTHFFAVELPTAATIIAVAIAVVLLWQGVLKELASSYGSLAKGYKEQLAEEKKKVATLTEAYKVALIEVDTTRLIRADHKETIKRLETELAIVRGLDIHKTEN